MISWIVFDTEEKFGLDQNGQAFHPGPVLPPGADGSPLSYGVWTRVSKHLMPMLLCMHLCQVNKKMIHALIEVETHQLYKKFQFQSKQAE